MALKNGFTVLYGGLTYNEGILIDVPCHLSAFLDGSIHHACHLAFNYGSIHRACHLEFK